MIHTGDCIEVMRGMEAESVDAVVTDPPYGLEFMGKGWDKFGAEVVDAVAQGGFQDGSGGNPFSRSRVRFGAGKSFMEWCEQWGREALRVTKPGGYLLAFGGTRTHHRLVCGLEDAGWIIRDELDWIYASGFPKGKANLKPAHEPIVLARKPGPLRPLAIDECRIGFASTEQVSDRDGEPAADTRYPEGPFAAKPGRRVSTSRKRYTVADTPAGMGKGQAMGGDGSPLGRWPSNVLLSDPELFDEPNPEVVGSGATATSGSRTGEYGGSGAWSGPFGAVDRDIEGDAGGYSRFFRIPEGPSRHSLNGGSETPSDESRQAQTTNGHVPSGYPSHFIIPKADRGDREPIVRGQLAPVRAGSMSGGEETRPDRQNRSNHPMRANSHPTVKPTDLMRHLVRLVTPTNPPGTVLDPFLGSGTTAIACELEGFPWIGIEREPEYVAIAEARLNGTQRGLGLDVPAPTKAPPKTHPDLSKHQPKRRAAADNYTGGWAGTDEEPAA